MYKSEWKHYVKIIVEETNINDNIITIAMYLNENVKFVVFA